MKTRDRILETAMALFNERQFGGVTTAALASELGIAEGNLWYHFPQKRRLLDAISERFLRDVEARLAMRPDPAHDVLARYAELLLAAAEEQQRYRFIYRDSADYSAHSEALKTKIPEIYGASRFQFEQFFRALKAAGHLTIAEERIETTVMNAMLIFRYALEFHREVGLPRLSPEKEKRLAIDRHLSVYEERLTPAALAALRAALNQKRDGGGLR